MKITGITTTLYQYKLTRRMGNAHTPAGWIHRVNCLVELHTDAGLTGIGIGTGQVQGQIEALVADVLAGEDPRGVTGLWQRMLDSRFTSRGGIVDGAISVLDMAMWDLKAKNNSEPLWKTLGCPRPRANVYASDNALPADDTEIYTWYGQMARDFGIREGKLKVGLDQTADLRRLGLMHKALSEATDTPVLMIDADEYWSPKQAVRKIREIEREYDLALVEAPVSGRDFLGLKRVSDGIRAAVCIPENLTVGGDFLPCFHHHAADIIQLNIAAVGITGALQLADTAYGFELPVTLSAVPGNVHAHLAGAMPYFMSMEVTDPQFPNGIVTTDVHIEDGWAIAGDKPGLGLEIDHGVLSEAQVDTLPSEFMSRREGAGRYEVPPTREELAVAARGLED